MSKHSPGPWKWEDWRDANGTWRLRDKAGDSVLRIHIDDHSREPNEDDARLIAAAPRMLDLLREFVGRWYVDDMSDLQKKTGALLAEIDGASATPPESAPPPPSPVGKPETH